MFPSSEIELRSSARLASGVESGAGGMTVRVSRRRALRRVAIAAALGVLVLPLTVTAASGADPIALATGGTIRNFTEGGVTYAVHTFTSDGTFAPTQALTVDYLVVGGGGGGGGRIGGGGGAGGLLTNVGLAGLPIVAGTYPVVVGSGGAGGSAASSWDGGDGGPSSVFGIVAVGGGGGGGTDGRVGRSGGSGGGGGRAVDASSGDPGSGGAGTAGQGFPGGTGSGKTPSIDRSGGGGGADGAGASGADSGDGGHGLAVGIIPVALATSFGVGEVDGDVVWYAGGGGGSAGTYADGKRETTPGDGGRGGGGNADDKGAGDDGKAHTGGGGGGGGYTEDSGAPPAFPGGAGGSGVVIIRYALPEDTGGSKEDSDDGGAATPVLDGGVAPSLAAGVAVLRAVDGTSTPLVVTSPAANDLRYSTDGLTVTFTGAPGTSVATGLVADANGEVVCEVCVPLAAGQVIEVWMFSAPRLVAAHLTDGRACQRFSIPLVAPLDGGGPVSAGAHTLQLAIPTASGMQAVNVGVTVGSPVPARVPAGQGGVPSGAALSLLLGAAGAALVAGRRLVTAG